MLRGELPRPTSSQRLWGDPDPLTSHGPHRGHGAPVLGGVGLAAARGAGRAAGGRGLPLPAAGPGARGQEDAGGAAGLPGRECGAPGSPKTPVSLGTLLGAGCRGVGAWPPVVRTSPVSPAPLLRQACEWGPRWPGGGSVPGCPSAPGPRGPAATRLCPHPSRRGRGARRGGGRQAPRPGGCPGLQPDAPLPSLQPTTQGAFLRGSGLSLASGRFTAPVAAIFQFSASLHLGEQGGRFSQRGPGFAVRAWVPSQSCLLLKPGSLGGLGRAPAHPAQLTATPVPALGRCPEMPSSPRVASPPSALSSPRAEPLPPQTAGACRAGRGRGTRCGRSSASRACAIATREWGGPLGAGVAGGRVGA